MSPSLGLRRRVGRPVPILLYHGVGIPPPGAQLPSLYVRPRSLRWQLRLLRVAGLRGVSVSEAIRYLDGEEQGRVVALTFDDAYRDVFENALPLLLEAGFTATCYAVSGRLGDHNAWDADRLRVRKPLMTVTQLEEWRAAGMEVGAHTRTHARLTDCTDTALADEVRGSRFDLEDLLGAEVKEFCYPYGLHDERVIAAIQDAGFRAAVTTRRGRARPADDRFRLPRVPVRGDRSTLGLPLRVMTCYEDRRG